LILLTVQDVTRQYDVEPVLKQVGFTLRKGERIGLVGPNGAGKTTLMNILVGKDEPDQGEVTVHSSVTIELLEQQADFPVGRTLIEEAKAGLNYFYNLQRESHRLAEEIATANQQEKLLYLQKRFDQIHLELEQHSAFQIDHRVEEVLTGLGFQQDQFDQPLQQMSGGQQSRALLARLLLRAPDLMLLDEPTNHLDLMAIEWLESFLVRAQQAMMIVSHDRFFLDRVTNRTLELNAATLTDYKGNFSAYWKQREERQKVQLRTQEKQQEFIAKTEEFIRKNKYGQKHAQAADREKKLARVEAVSVLRTLTGPPMAFPEPKRTGDWVFDVEDLAQGYDDLLFSNLTFQILRGERVGILGPNGSGKTTLLKTLTRQLKPRQGGVRHGTNVEIGYSDQLLQSVDPAVDAIVAARPPNKPAVTPALVRDMLARFGIRGDQAIQKVGSMSGGERNKVALARVALLNCNVMILDEPTNHLDLWACDALETALKEFSGTVLFVSHDRYFLDQVATRVIVLQDGGCALYDGNYSDYLQFLSHERQQQQIQKNRKENQNNRQNKPSANEKTQRRKRKYAYRKVEDLELDIAEHERQLGQLQQDMADPELNKQGDRIKVTIQEFEQTKLKLEQLYEHWEEAVELN